MGTHNGCALLLLLAAAQPAFGLARVSSSLRNNRFGFRPCAAAAGGLRAKVGAGRLRAGTRVYGKIPTDLVERLKRTNALGPYRQWMDSMTIVDPAQLDSTLQNDGYEMLDVRPSFEKDETSLPFPAKHIPIYEKAEGDDTKVQQFLAWAQGTTFTQKNDKFIQLVKEAFPDNSTKIAVGCKGGIRSILAVKEMQNAGFKNVAWVGGGMKL
eukprot:CAMPEP_0197518124 /NCGR_PEP_ID=MMETSP1318-20131121/3256_1 /TAXON_ID=552666 /ORGANISM="Partenskyella glossopodia, Strain RCC365" /LENGTH=210 /DNA_ID=CAMNT_0043068221 /DNA_START=11 /DNA_END=643 /DNA_ORIENTATION=-